MKTYGKHHITIRKPLLLATLVVFGIQPLMAAPSSEALLLQELRKRDAVIAQLIQRVERLEKSLKAAVTRIEAKPDTGDVKHQIDDLQSRLERLAQAKTAGEAPPTGIGSGARKKKANRPGAVQVDEYAAERALERTLANEGALLLPYGVYEISPFISYTRRDRLSPVYEDASGAALPGGSHQQSKRDSFNIGVGIRVGLPYDSQLELTFPYRVVHQETIVTVPSSGASLSNKTGRSIGDVSVGLAKTLFREEGWRPDLIGRLVWNSATGEQSDNGVSLGLGFNELTASLTALKRQDPLAFTATLGYTKTLEKNGIEPGDQYSLALGTSIAASPTTSLSFTLSQVFGQESKINGQTSRGSSINSSQFLVGVSSSISRLALLSFSAGIGLTEDAPDYTFSFSLPIRFY